MKVINSDCEKGLNKLENESVDLVITSPPYGNLRKYENVGEKFDFEKFKRIAQNLKRVLKNGGVIVWVVGDSVIYGSETGDCFRQALFFKEIGLNIHDTMIWEKPSPACPTQDRYYDVFEYMFIFSKGKPKTMNFLCDRKNSSFGSKSKKETRSCREDRKYKNESRIVKEFSRRFNVWNISRGINKTEHPAVFPERLSTDHILTWSNEGDTVIDPFCGSGTVGVSAVKTKRKFIGFEISEKYCKIAEERIRSVENENNILQTSLF